MTKVYEDRGERGSLILAEIDGMFDDGDGDGATGRVEDEFLRGEV